jgi:hypothetical protein
MLTEGSSFPKNGEVQPRIRRKADPVDVAARSASRTAKNEKLT